MKNLPSKKTLKLSAISMAITLLVAPPLTLADPFVGSELWVTSGSIQYDYIDIDNQNASGSGINLSNASLIVGDTNVDLINPSNSGFSTGIWNVHGTMDLGKTTVNVSSPGYLQGVISDGNSSLDSLSITVNSEDNVAMGLYLCDSNDTDEQNNRFNVSGQTIVQVNAGSTAYGILSLNGDGYGNIGQTDQIYGDVEISVSGGNDAYGFYNDGNASLKSLNIKNVTATKGDARGVFLLNTFSTVDADIQEVITTPLDFSVEGHTGILVTATDGDAYGIDFNGDNEDQISIKLNSLNIEANGSDKAYGINIDEGTGKSTPVTIAGPVNIIANAGNNDAVGIWAARSELTIKDSLEVQVTSQATNKRESYGLMARDNSTVTIEGPATISASNTATDATKPSEIAAVIARDSTVIFNDRLDASISGDVSLANGTNVTATIRAIGSTIFALHGGTIDASGGIAVRESEISGGGQLTAGKVVLSSDKDNTLTILGDLVSTYGQIDVTLGTGSSFIGNSRQEDSGAVLLNLSGGTWTPNGSSTVSTLSSDGNGGTVDLEKMTETDQINISTLSGGDTRFATDHPIAGSVVIENKQETGRAVVSTTGDINDGYVDPKELVNDYSAVIIDKNGNAAADGVLADEGRIYGALSAESDSSGNWVISRAENLKLANYFDAASLSVLSWRHELDDYHERMGEIRDNSASTGAWARIYGSEQEYGYRHSQSQSTSIQVGADTAIGNWRVGAAFSYSDGDLDLHQGDGESDNYSIGAYATYVLENGSYLDVMAKYSRLSVDFDIREMSGSYDNNGMSISVEGGHKFSLSDSIFVEPQVAITYGYLSGDDFKSANGVKIEQDDFNSLIGRIGFRAGYSGLEDRMHAYVKASVLHDFIGDMDSKFTSMITGTSVNLSDNFGDTWVEYGVGGSFAFTDRANGYAEFERTSGGSLDENWRFNVGFRYTF